MKDERWGKSCLRLFDRSRWLCANARSNLAQSERHLHLPRETLPLLMRKMCDPIQTNRGALPLAAGPLVLLP
jgi:hypothetical protein